MRNRFRAAGSALAGLARRGRGAPAPTPVPDAVRPLSRRAASPGRSGTGGSPDNN